MRGIFFNVLEINIAAAVIILILCFLADKLRKRYGAAWMKLAWLLLAVRLLIPYNFSLPFTEIRLFNIPGFAQEESAVQDIDLAEAALDMDNENGNGSMLQADPMVYYQEGQYNQGNAGQIGTLQNAIPAEDTKPADDVNPRENAYPLWNTEAASGRTEAGGEFAYSDILVRIWILGIGICLIYHIFHYLLFGLKCRENLRPVTDINFRKQIVALERKFTGKGNIPFYQSRSVSSPMLIGVFSPKLVFPACHKQWTEEELELIMAHELCHYQRKDIALKFFMTIVCCLNWFNPTVYFMKKQFFYDMELACDGSVLLERDAQEREAYARMMLSFAGNRKDMSTFSTGFLESKNRMKKRIDYMLDGGRKKKGIISIAVTGVLVLILSVVVSCGYQPERIDAEDVRTEDETDKAETDSTDQPGEEIEEKAFDYNHEYNEMIRCYENDIYIAREDGIYCMREGEDKEELVYENTYSLRRGMEIYQDVLYFCGAVTRGEEEAATIYRMQLDTHETEDALAAFSQRFDALYSISVYEDKLYVSSGYEQRIGFELDEEGQIVRGLDAAADDFLYREYNDYMELELQKMQAGADTEEYWDLVEETGKRYRAVMDVASCKKMLNGRQVVSQYKDELLRSIYLEGEDGTYEYLCDAAGYPMIVTETGLYYAAEENGEIWYIDYETKNARKIYAREGREWAELQLVNYDVEYIYVLKSRRIGSDMEGNSVKETYLVRVPREGGEAQKVYLFEEDFGLNGLYKHCGVAFDRMYFEDREAISLDPAVNGMQEADSGAFSEDAAEMTRAVKEFASAYFRNDVETLRLYLAEDFADTIDMYSYPEQAEQIEETYIGGLPERDVPVGVSCNVFYEFSGLTQTDGALAYLDIEMIKTQQGWKVKWYGIEL